MKPHDHHGLHIPDRVAPLAGAWIETPSEPEWPELREVAPLAGAWIETQHVRLKPRVGLVAPLAVFDNV